MTSTLDVGSFFGTRAARYDRAYDARSADGHALRARMAVVERLVGPGPGELLDVGMGPGRLCALLERRGWTVSGVDASADMVAAAHDRLPHAAGRLLQGDVERLAFADETFDAVVATGVLEYVRLPQAIREVARVLRPGGRAVVSYPNSHSAYGFSKTRLFYPAVRAVKRALSRPGLPPTPSRLSEPQDIARLLEETGLGIDAVEYASFLALPSPIDELLPHAAARLGERLEGSGPRWGHRLATQVVFAARKGVR